MHRRLPHTLALGLMLVIGLAGCTAAASPTPEITPLPTPTEEPTLSPTPSPEATPTAEPTASPTTAGFPGGFTVAPNPDADALFAERDECQNLEAGYQLQFPEAWYTNTEIGGVPPCSWFSATFYEVDTPGDTPEEVVIEIFVVDGDRGYTGEVLRREEVTVGATQTAFRLEVQGTARGTSGQMYEYVVQLGPTPEEGPNLVARTDTAMGGAYELNKAILDRIMATMEFIGTIQ